MLRGDGVEDGPDDPVVDGGRVAVGWRGGHRLASDPGRPQPAGDPDHLGADGGVFPLGAGEDAGGGQVAPEGVAQLLFEELSPEEPLSVGGRHDDVAEIRFEDRQGGLGGVGGGTKSRHERHHGGVVGSRLAGGDRLIGELPDAGDLADRGLGMEPRYRSPARTDELLPGRVEDDRYGLEPGGRRREPRRQRARTRG